MVPKLTQKHEKIQFHELFMGLGEKRTAPIDFSLHFTPIGVTFQKFF